MGLGTTGGAEASGRGRGRAKHAGDVVQGDACGFASTLLQGCLAAWLAGVVTIVYFHRACLRLKHGNGYGEITKTSI